jgi:PhzF family phenazine biosynthesis protein
MRIPIYQVDAFTDRLFAGNPAAICPLKEWLPDEALQSIAAENNLSETAFFLREGDGYALRWFTPVLETDLCGHATLASAHVVFRFLEPEARRVAFTTRKAGTLTVSRQGDTLAMDFPARTPLPCPSSPELAKALGAEPVELLAGVRDYLAVFPTAEHVAALHPDFAALARLERPVIVTAPGRDGIDFVSRFFAPSAGINEDPVTGSAHCGLTPYWAQRIGKTQLEARQISSRGGALTCTLQGDRVILAGRAVLYMEGWITV